MIELFPKNEAFDWAAKAKELYGEFGDVLPPLEAFEELPQPSGIRYACVKDVRLIRYCDMPKIDLFK